LGTDQTTTGKPNRAFAKLTTEKKKAALNKESYPQENENNACGYSDTHTQEETTFNSIGKLIHGPGGLGRRKGKEVDQPEETSGLHKKASGKRRRDRTKNEKEPFETDPGGGHPKREGGARI